MAWPKKGFALRYYDVAETRSEMAYNFPIHLLLYFSFIITAIIALTFVGVDVS